MAKQLVNCHSGNSKIKSPTKGEKIMAYVNVNYRYHERGRTSEFTATISLNTDDTSDAALKKKIEQMKPHHVVVDILNVR